MARLERASWLVVGRQPCTDPSAAAQEAYILVTFKRIVTNAMQMFCDAIGEIVRAKKLT